MIQTETVNTDQIMSTSNLSDQIQALEFQALEIAEDLAIKLQEISEMHWCGQPDQALFRASASTLETLREIEVILAAPISEIQSAA